MVVGLGGEKIRVKPQEPNVVSIKKSLTSWRRDLNRSLALMLAVVLTVMLAMMLALVLARMLALVLAWMLRLVNARSILAAILAS